MRIYRPAKRNNGPACAICETNKNIFAVKNRVRKKWRVFESSDIYFNAQRPSSNLLFTFPKNREESCVCKLKTSDRRFIPSCPFPVSFVLRRLNYWLAFRTLSSAMAQFQGSFIPMSILNFVFLTEFTLGDRIYHAYCIWQKSFFGNLHGFEVLKYILLFVRHTD